MTGETLTENFESFFNSASKISQYASPLLVGNLCPLLYPAAIWPISFARGKSSGVGYKPEQDEIGIDFAVEHGFEVKFEKRLAGECRVVSHDAQVETIG